ncbi:zinc-dependent metalloprotease [Demequina muriae]|uniref:Zinc-dependent metalloprotease n=1 Tax=Demequina muriae TaxID=3051664 RepID=A0ABT8GHS2_9MICO|nr:zinc-dependent metalloprotease [Demequina sp. EGI L300058]MDN4480987.1 zinc-dependent metalloprotease [Demequina sp. EGI L300058]
MTDDQTPWMRLLRELFGDDAEAALEELERMGMDPAALAQASGMLSNPAMLDHVLGQIRSLVAQSQGEDVNWQLAHDVARGVAAQGGDPTVTAHVASEHRAAVSRAELWLDAATDFDPSGREPRVWSRAEWIEATMPTWRVLAGPVATSVSKALSGILGAEGGGTGLGAESSALVGSVSPTVCGMHVGQAAGEMARDAFGATDLGFPLLAEPRVVLVPSAIDAFAGGLGVPEDEVRAYIALREAAHVRLFSAVPWLPGHLHTLIEKYAAGISIDVEALDEAVRDVGFEEPAKMQEALTQGIFASHHSDEQRETLASIETLLALIEGWVQEVTVRAAAPHLPSIGALREMMQRRRATGGPAEDAFATLLGLELRPRRLRDAAALWARLSLEAGPEERDRVWAHPDVLPGAAALDDPQAWVAQWLGGAEEDDVDRALEALLAEGLGDGSPASDPDDGEQDPGASGTPGGAPDGGSPRR